MDDTLLDEREAPEFGQSYVPRGIENAAYVPTEAMRGQPERIHPAVSAWRHSASMWRDRCHEQEQRCYALEQSAAFWKSMAVGLSIGIVLGISAWRLLP
jgi:hypothetical protein